MQLTLKRTHPGVPHERHNATMWTVMMTGYYHLPGWKSTSGRGRRRGE